MTPQEMNLLRRVTDKVTDLIWLTRSDNMQGSSPDLTLARGLSRALMLEIPSLRFAVLDIGGVADISNKIDRERVCSEVERSLWADDVPDDKEFSVLNGILHTSRFVPDNAKFSQRNNQQPSEMTLEAASPARLAIKAPGNMDTIYFQQESQPEADLPGGDVDVEVKAVSLNAKVFGNVYR